MRINFGTSSYERSRGDMPSLPVINMFIEEAPTEETTVALQSRPGLSDRSADMGMGPVKALFKRDLVLGSALFGVSAGFLYKDTANIGSIDGSGVVSMAGYENYLFVNAGASIYTYDDTMLSTIAFPDGADVAHITVGASRLIAIRKDTGKFYWSSALGTTIDALDFATAENAPDRALQTLFIDDILIVFGAETVEFWPNTSDPDLPFTPLEGRVIEKGLKATGCATAFGSTFAWVTNENTVCVTDENTIISNNGLQERIEASSEVSLWSFLQGGNEYIALRLDNETQIYSQKTGNWSEFQSYGQTNWIPQCFAGDVFGSAIDGRTFAWSSGWEDLGGVMERRFRAGFPIESGGVDINNVQVRSNVGQTTYLTGDYTDPSIEMRISRNVGKTWGNWKARTFGVQGDYGKKVQWRGCGQASHPGFLAEFRVTDPVDVRISNVLVNEGYGGR